MASNAENRLKQDSEHEQSDYESCGEEVETGDKDGDLTRPSDWTPDFQDARESQQNEEDSGGGAKAQEVGGAEGVVEEELDSTGEEKDSPDYVDEKRLEREETKLSQEEREQRRTEATELKQQGNSLYKEGKTEDAVKKYTEGLNTCPLSFAKDRSVLYANRAQMYRVLGKKDQAIKNCSRAVELDPVYLKAFLRRAKLFEENEKLDEALEDYKRIIELDPNNNEARRALATLPQRIEERNEKMKEEMMQNLKKLGNMVLKPFGLSTENFNMVQDPSTGGYNVQFSQNK